MLERVYRGFTEDLQRVYTLHFLNIIISKSGFNQLRFDVCMTVRL